MPDRVVDYLVRAVAAAGVRHIFGVDGANIEDLYDALFESEVTGVVAKHEFSAATMADGAARTTSGLGVVCATSGGGAMNLVAGLAEAYASRVPVLALIGQPPVALEGHGAFQDSSGLGGTIDGLRLFGTVTRYCARVEHPGELPGKLARALSAARSGGPAALLLPKDVQQAAITTRPLPAATPRADPGDRIALDRVRAALTAAREVGKVVIIAGDQVARDDARDGLARLAAALDAGVGVTPEAKDTYDNTAPNFCGVAGTMGHPELLTAIRSAALCLLVGTTMPMTARTGLAEHLTAHPLASVGAAPPHLAAVHAGSTDLTATMDELAAHWDPTPEASADRPGGSSLTALAVPGATGPGMRYRTVVEHISAALPAGTDVFSDAGNTGASVVHHLLVPRGGRFVVALGMGGMGYAFGAGVGSAFARHRGPHGVRRTVVIAGDGAFYMHGSEIHTALEHRLPITFILFNNNAHAMCVTREQLFYRDRYSFNRFRTAHLADGLRAMYPGLPACTARTADELNAALDRCLTTDGPSIMEVLCDPDEIPPFIPFLPSTA